MKEVLEGNLELDQATPHIDRCLGCLACETNCPSGVVYGELISPFRDYARSRRKVSWGDRLRRRLVMATLPYPQRFRWSLLIGRYTRWLRPATPKSLRPMIDMIPDRVPRAERLKELYPAEGRQRGVVALLAGCAQQVLAPEINLATIRVLTRNGVEVRVPKQQGCCGALAWHVGEAEVARKTAGLNLAAFPQQVDAIITNAAGCGSGMKEYPLLFKETPRQEEAAAFAERVVDVSVYLEQLGIEPPAPLQTPVRVGYHDACHLAHAQSVRLPPRRLLQRIEGLELVELFDGETCCGSAGTYNIDEPELAERLGKRKAAVIEQAGCDVVAAGNIGCLIQIDRYVGSSNAKLPVLHPVEILDRAYRGKAIAG